MLRHLNNVMILSHSLQRTCMPFYGQHNFVAFFCVFSVLKCRHLFMYNIFNVRKTSMQTSEQVNYNNICGVECV